MGTMGFAVGFLIMMILDVRGERESDGTERSRRIIRRSIE